MMLHKVQDDVGGPSNFLAGGCLLGPGPQTNDGKVITDIPGQPWATAAVNLRPRGLVEERRTRRGGSEKQVVNVVEDPGSALLTGGGKHDAVPLITYLYKNVPFPDHPFESPLKSPQRARERQTNLPLPLAAFRPFDPRRCPLNHSTPPAPLRLK